MGVLTTTSLAIGELGGCGIFLNLQSFRIHDLSFYDSGSGQWRDIGFTASMIQMAAATIFWISTMFVLNFLILPSMITHVIEYSTGLPGVIDGFPEDPSVGLTDGVYWTPQVIGGSGFVAASLLLMREEQKSWWRLAPLRVGWCVIGYLFFTVTQAADNLRHVGKLLSGISLELLDSRCAARLDTRQRVVGQNTKVLAQHTGAAGLSLSAAFSRLSKRCGKNEYLPQSARRWQA
jgi:hypothetical protein